MINGGKSILLLYIVHMYQYLINKNQQLIIILYITLTLQNANKLFYYFSSNSNIILKNYISVINNDFYFSIYRTLMKLLIQCIILS